MKSNEITNILNDYLKINNTKIYCFAEIIISLLKVKTVNLVELSCGMEGEAKQESKYKRLKRFFCNAKINQLDVVRAYA